LMAKKRVVTRVWIDPGCIACNACQSVVPTVFQVTEETCVIRPEALDAAFLKPLSEAIFDAAEECPTEVIKYEVEEEGEAGNSDGAEASEKTEGSTGEEKEKVKEGKKDEAQKPSRRGLLTGSAAMGVGWVAFGGAVTLSFGPMFGRFMMPNASEEPDPRVRIGPLEKYAVMRRGDVNEDFKGEGILIVRLEKSIAALSTVCTHLGCIVNWLAGEKKFKCPCHGSGFYQNGINFEGPAPRALDRFAIRVEDGIVVVDKSRKFQYEMRQWGFAESSIAV